MKDDSRFRVSGRAPLVRRAFRLGLGALLAGSPAAGGATLLKLEGDYLSMAEVRSVGPQGHQLVVFEAGRQRPRRARQAEVFDKRQGTLTKSPSVVIPADAATFDVCRLSPPGAAAAKDAVLLLRPGGVYPLGSPTPLVRVETLMPHARDDALPRLRLCFDLFRGEGPALVVPQLAGVAIFRQEQPGIFRLHANLASEADVRFQWQLLRDEALERTQRVAVRFEFPDVTAPDVDGDGDADLCFTQAEAVTCHLQDQQKGWAEGGAGRRQHRHELLSDEEKLSTSLRLDARLVELTGDGRPDLVVNKINWSLSEMGASLHVYPQSPAGTYPARPTQVLKRAGYFAYHEYLDFDGDGKVDLLAPVASLGWTDLARIYLSKSAEIDFVWYKNLGGRFDPEARPIHKLHFPVEFRNLSAILGALPLWDVRVGLKGRSLLFFPEKQALDLRGMGADGQVTGQPLWRERLRLGSDALRTDLDGNGLDELVFAYPRDKERSDALLFVDTPVLTP